MESSAAGVAAIGVGAFIILTRGPLLLAPKSTFRLFRWLIASNPRVRRMGAVLLVLAAGVIWAGTSEVSVLARALTIFGGVVAAIVVLALLVFPGIYRELADAVMPLASERSFAGWRLVGALGTGIGLLIIRAGLRAL